MNILLSIGFPRLVTLLAVSWVTGCGGQAISDAERETQVGSAGEMEAREEAECWMAAYGASLVQGIDPPQKLDGLALVTLDERHRPTSLLDEEGEICPGSLEPIDCLKPDGMLPGFYSSEEDLPHALLARFNGELVALGYWEIREVLGEVNTTNEAAILAWTEGWSPNCEDIQETDGAYIVAAQLPCDSSVEEFEVTSDGTVSLNAFCP